MPSGAIIHERSNSAVMDRTPWRARREQTSTRAGHKPGQRRNAAMKTTDQCWRCWDDATEELNRRDYMNLFTVEAETAAVRPTECRLYRGRLHRYNVQYVAVWVSGSRLDHVGGAVNEGTCGIPATDDSSELRERTTSWSIGWERTMPYVRTENHADFTC